ncbi:uncharacterized protein I206_106074 [Kwoniella pini CBS 10737]|uniref:Uncharacterized protein n=1 Tax=Kwoniella pini CBS 10737 TaxID=1296096 RepID=A0A1B9I0Z3_9TREE|nr:uncharacterized protein I206_04897 [Kwoniella pini CBS 10737]OCF49209.1 hypothetical protein I206_04897 [Kwoniella pini CBS 10737]
MDRIKTGQTDHTDDSVFWDEDQEEEEREPYEGNPEKWTEFLKSSKYDNRYKHSLKRQQARNVNCRDSLGNSNDQGQSSHQVDTNKATMNTSKSQITPSSTLSNDNPRDYNDPQGGDTRFSPQVHEHTKGPFGFATVASGSLLLQGPSRTAKIGEFSPSTCGQYGQCSGKQEGIKQSKIRTRDKMENEFQRLMDEGDGYHIRGW